MSNASKRSGFSVAALMAVVVLALWGIGGCARPASESGGAGQHADAHDEHEHSEVGPHDGHIIELGTEDYHAELTHDDATHKIGVYMLGSDAKTAKPIAAESVMINAAVDGKPTQYVLTAVPQAGETAGQSSYFELVSEPLAVLVAGKSESKNSHARLSLSIDGKPFVGMIETNPHDHDHGHEH